MGFQSHKVVQDFTEEFKNIVEMRDYTKEELVHAFEKLKTAKNESDRLTYMSRISELEQRLDTLTRKGERYMRKIDELNGVR